MSTTRRLPKSPKPPPTPASGPVQLLTLFKKAFAEGRLTPKRARPEWGPAAGQAPRPLPDAHQRYWKNPPSGGRRSCHIEVRNKLVKSISMPAARFWPADTRSGSWAMASPCTASSRTWCKLGSRLIRPWLPPPAMPREFLHALQEWGTIEPGKRADLVLLDANPLDDIRNTTHIEGVSIGGRWLDKTQLQQMLRQAMPR